MKTIFTLSIITYLFFSLAAQGQSKKTVDSLKVTIQLGNRTQRNSGIDSVFVIFDKHNLSGAGVIKQIFYPVNNQIVIEKVPKGKYYIEVSSLGYDQQSFNDIATISDRRNNKVKIRFTPSEPYTPGSANIPNERINSSQLIVNKPDYAIAVSKSASRSLRFSKRKRQPTALMCAYKPL
jgi:hypothetical protein